MNNYQAYDYMARSAQVMHEGLSILNDFSTVIERDTCDAEG
jgi:poly(3-hydroxybutyrate) depolymerase